MQKLSLDKVTFSALLAAGLLVLGIVLATTGLGDWLQGVSPFTLGSSWFMTYKLPVLIALTAAGFGIAYFVTPMMKDPFIRLEQLILGLVFAIPMFFATSMGDREVKILLDNGYGEHVDVEVVEMKKKLRIDPNKYRELIVPCAPLTFVDFKRDGGTDTFRFQPQPDKNYIYNYQNINLYELQTVEYGSSLVNQLNGGSGTKVLKTYTDKIFDYKSDFLFTAPEQIAVSSSNAGTTSRTLLARMKAAGGGSEAEAAEDFREQLLRLIEEKKAEKGR
jgi:hypothetical protein